MRALAFVVAAALAANPITVFAADGGAPADVKTVTVSNYLVPEHYRTLVTGMAFSSSKWTVGEDAMEFGTWTIKDDRTVVVARYHSGTSGDPSALEISGLLCRDTGAGAKADWFECHLILADASKVKSSKAPMNCGAFATGKDNLWQRVECPTVLELISPPLPPDF